MKKIKMKKVNIVAAAFLFLVVSASATEQPTDKKEAKFPITFALGVHTGTDIGGAVPMPLGKAIGGEDKINASFGLRPQLGISATAAFHERWSLTLEATYKMLALSAKAWVENQIFTDRSGETWVEASFRGTALMKMSFPMFEFPLYMRYTFGGGNNRILLGGYYARVFNAKFESTPYKGMLFNLVDGKPDYDNPSSIVSPDDPYTHNFTDAMSKWDAGIILGYERKIFIPRLLIGCRFLMGFNDIFQPDKKYLDYKMTHMRGTLTVSYIFSKF
ncbi:MAG: PorT family protein [Bacteroidales bacterium]|nr:PorT family protein [Bacteroidales bacterium]MCL2132819.1 PorT family protein [Bacteroidales bacterium]